LLGHANFNIQLLRRFETGYCCFLNRLAAADNSVPIDGVGNDSRIFCELSKYWMMTLLLIENTNNIHFLVSGKIALHLVEQSKVETPRTRWGYYPKIISFNLGLVFFQAD